jgi:hypothetical protein
VQQDTARGQSLRGPKRAYFQRLTGDHAQVSSNGRLTLTGTHLVFDGRIGVDVVIPLQDVAGARDQKMRRFHIGGHDSQLVIATGPVRLVFCPQIPRPGPKPSAISCGPPANKTAARWSPG